MDLERDVLVSPTTEVPVVEGEVVLAIRALADCGVGSKAIARQDDWREGIAAASRTSAACRGRCWATMRARSCSAAIAAPGRSSFIQPVWPSVATGTS